MAETPDILEYDCCLLGLYDDSRLVETPDNLGMTSVYWACMTTARWQRRRTTLGIGSDCCLLGLYDDSRLVETPDNLWVGYDCCVLACTTTAGWWRRQTSWGMTAVY